MARAYDHMIRGEILLGQRELDQALEAHREALDLAPDRPEIAFWTAVSYVAVDEIDAALPLFRQCFRRSEGWRELVDRLVEPGILPDDEDLLRRIREA